MRQTIPTVLLALTLLALPSCGGRAPNSEKNHAKSDDSAILSDIPRITVDELWDGIWDEFKDNPKAQKGEYDVKHYSKRYSSFFLTGIFTDIAIEGEDGTGVYVAGPKDKKKIIMIFLPTNRPAEDLYKANLEFTPLMRKGEEYLFIVLEPYLEMRELKTRFGAICAPVDLLEKEVQKQGVEYKRFDGATDKAAAKPILRLCDKVFHLFQYKRREELYQMLTDEAKAKLTLDQFTKQNQNILEFFGESQGANVLELHWMKVQGELPEMGSGQAPSIQIVSEYLPKPAFAVPALPGETVVALCEAMTELEDSRFWLTLFLAKQGKDEWRLHAFQMKPRILEGRNGYHFLKQAEALAKAGKARSAFLYRFIGASLFMPSSFIFARSAYEQARVFFGEKAPSNLPFPKVRKSETWADSATGKTFPVVSVIPSMTEPELCLEVHYNTKLTGEALEGEAGQAERQALCDLLLLKFPEYQDIFPAILVRSITAKGEIGSTIFDIEEEPEESDGNEEEVEEED